MKNGFFESASIDGKSFAAFTKAVVRVGRLLTLGGISTMVLYSGVAVTGLIGFIHFERVVSWVRPCTNAGF